MGLISFLKSAGEKLGIIDGDDNSAEAATKKIEEMIEGYGFDVENLNVTITGDTALITGEAASFAEKEKVVLVAGNTQGIGGVDDQMTVKAGAEGTADEAGGGVGAASYHTVESGDTLSAISKKAYGDPNKYNVIFEANKPMLKHPDKIYPGQVLRIPPLA